MTFLIALALFVFVLGVALNALFAGYETGFISADIIRIRFMSEEVMAINLAIIEPPSRFQWYSRAGRI